MFQNLSEKLEQAFRKFRHKGRLTEADVRAGMRDIKLALLEADVNFRVVRDFMKSVTERAVGAEVLESLLPGQQVVKIVREEMTRLMGGAQAKLQIAPKPPTVVMMVGLQGAGKTTHAAKLAAYYKRQGKRPLLAACDVYRPAAVKQLLVLGEQAGVPVFEMGDGEDPVRIAEESLRYAEGNLCDMVFLDTAGRLQIDEAMMAELSRIKERTRPTEILLTVDAMIGQEAVNVADAFNRQLDITGVILTKLDGDTRGGAALSVRYVTGKPIKFVGVGEKLNAIEPFHPDRMAGRILGMGDVLTLIDKAQQQLDERQTAELEEKIRRASFTMDDFLEQYEQIRNMGGVEQLAAMIPGVRPGSLRDAQIDEGEIARRQAIIRSMTPAERVRPDALLNASRKRRIAAGSGTTVEEVNRLLRQYAEIKRIVRQFSDAGRSPGKRGFGRGKLKLPF